MPSLCKHHLEPHKTTLEPQSTCPAYANTIWTLQMQKDPNTIWTRAENRPNRKPKKLFHVIFGIHIKQKQSFGDTEHMPSLCKHHLEAADAKGPKHHLRCPAHANTIWTLQMPSLCKHHLDTADAKRPKHHLDTSRKPPKPQAKISFTLPCPAYANTIYHCRCKKTQTPSGHEPKTAQTASQKTLSRYLWNPHIKLKQSLEPQSTCPAYANTIWNHIKQLWSHRAHAQPMQTPSSTADAKKTKHHLDTSRKPPKPQAKKLFHVTFGIHIKQKQSLEPQSTCPALCKHHLEPHKTTLEPQSTCPAYANTI